MGCGAETEEDLERTEHPPLHITPLIEETMG
jgi:hypothetical protein